MPPNLNTVALPEIDWRVLLGVLESAYGAALQNGDSPGTLPSMTPAQQADAHYLAHRALHGAQLLEPMPMPPTFSAAELIHALIGEIKAQTNLEGLQLQSIEAFSTAPTA